jgi:uncharacterized protein (DUF433 family)
MDSRERIVVDPEIRFGKPTIKGTRISLGDILEYLAGGDSEEDILAEFPQLTREDIRACLAFAAERERYLRRADEPPPPERKPARQPNGFPRCRPQAAR